MLGGSMNPSAGKADPYWYEWDVGLEEVIEMLHPDTTIASVEFQRNGLKGWDDVVVRFVDDSTHFYQVKHSRVGHNLTFGSLVQLEDGASLLSSLFDAWKIMGHARGNSRFFLYTNREAGDRESTTAAGVKRPALKNFIVWLRETLATNATISAIAPPEEWNAAWREWLGQLNGSDREQHEFLTALQIDYAQEDSPVLEERLVHMLQSSFATTKEKAVGLFQGLTNGLRLWTTSRFNRPVQVEDVLQALSLPGEASDEEPAPPPPTPFFPSRKHSLDEITDALSGSGPKVVFLCGEPGAGKTSLVSSLTVQRTARSLSGLVGLRYFAYRPITVESPIIPADADQYIQPERLWYTLLSQMRRGLRGRLRQYRVPVRNNLIPWRLARDHVLRIADELGRELNRDFVIVIDGIDHAARASRYDPRASKGFFDSLPSPDELTNRRIRLMVAGQQPAAYPEYPHWLSTHRDDVHRLDVGKLDDDDVRLLLNSVNAELATASGDAVVRLVREETGGNTLAVVFAADESRHCHSIDEFRKRLNRRRLKDGLLEYYDSIWSHATGRSQGRPDIALPLASFFFVARERITAKMFAQAFSGVGCSEIAWQQSLDTLEPLIIAEPGGYRVRHNDVRVFLHSVLEAASPPVRRSVVGMLFDYYRSPMSNRLAAHRGLLHLARESGRLLEWPKVFSLHWVFEAASLGITYQEMQDQCIVALEQAAFAKDWQLMLEVTCAAETLEAWEDRCMGGWFDSKKPPAEPEAPFLYSEGTVTPIEHWTMHELQSVLDDADALIQEGQMPRAHDLLARWFGGMTLSALFIELAKMRDDTPAPLAGRNQRSGLAARFGRTFRSAMLVPPRGDEPSENSKELSYQFELGWIDASTLGGKEKTIAGAYAGMPPRYYGCIGKAIIGFADAGAWHLVREAFKTAPRNRSHFAGSFKVRAAWLSLRAGLGTKSNPWLEILQSPKFGLPQVEEERVLCGIDVARALGWTKVALDTGSIARDVYAAQRDSADSEEKPSFIALYRAAATLGRIASTLESKGPQVTGELVPAKEVGQAATALWSEAMHGGPRRFEHRALAGSLATELVVVAVGLSEAHKQELLIAAANVPKFRLDDRKESLWELYKRTGHTGELRAWLDRWLGENGWLWVPDTGSKDSTLNELLPLAHELGEADLAGKAISRASWLRITYRGHKDASYRPLYLWLRTLGEQEPTCWRDLGVTALTLRQSAREAGCDNEYGTEIDELVAVLAYRSGPDDIRRLLLADESAKDGENRFYDLRNRMVNGAIQFAQQSTSLSDDVAVAIWCLALGWSRWHDSLTVSRLRSLKDELISNAADVDRGRALAAKLARISSPQSTREPPPNEDSSHSHSRNVPDTQTAADFLKEVQYGNTILPSAALTVVQHLQLTRPAGYSSLVSKVLAQVGPSSPYGGTWHYDDRQSSSALRKIAELISDDQLWILIDAANLRIGKGSSWLQPVTDNLFDVLLARASRQGAVELRAGIEAICDMHEHWLRGGQKTEAISKITIPLTEVESTWADAVETSLDIIIGSRSADVVASGLQATQAWVTAHPERIPHLFKRWHADEWKGRWLLTLAERWAADYPKAIEAIRMDLETIARERMLHLRLQAWLVLLMLASSRSANLPPFPANPHYQRKDDGALLVPPRELLETPDRRVGSSRFVDRFGATEGILRRVGAALSSDLSNVETKLAGAVLNLPDPEKPATFPENLHADGDLYCSLSGLEPVLSQVFEQELANQPLSSNAMLKFAQGYLHSEDSWIVTESPLPSRDVGSWPSEKLLDPGYGVPTDCRTLERVCFVLATTSEVPDDEIVVAAKLELYRTTEDFEFLMWYQESESPGTSVTLSKPPTTISARTFPWRAGRWYERQYPEGNRPLVQFAGALNLLHHCGVDIVPTTMWRSKFDWTPRHANPLEWAANGKTVARYQRIHGPLRRARRGHFRQPLLARWLVSKDAWEIASAKLRRLSPMTSFNSYKSDAEH